MSAGSLQTSQLDINVELGLALETPTPISEFDRTHLPLLDYAADPGYQSQSSPACAGLDDRQNREPVPLTNEVEVPDISLMQPEITLSHFWGLCVMG